MFETVLTIIGVAIAIPLCFVVDHAIRFVIWREMNRREEDDNGTMRP